MNLAKSVKCASQRDLVEIVVGMLLVQPSQARLDAVDKLSLAGLVGKTISGLCVGGNRPLISTDVEREDAHFGNIGYRENQDCSGVDRDPHVAAVSGAAGPRKALVQLHTDVSEQCAGTPNAGFQRGKPIH